MQELAAPLGRAHTPAFLSSQLVLKTGFLRNYLKGTISIQILDIIFPSHRISVFSSFWVRFSDAEGCL